MFYFSISVYFLKLYLCGYMIYFCFIVFLSLFSLKLGFSKSCVKLLSKVFQYVENSRRKLPDFESEPKITANNVPIIPKDVYDNVYASNILQNGKIPNYSSTIKRDIILLPELCGLRIQSTNNDCQLSESLKNVFELSDIMMYVKAGVEAVVEDQITSRFISEELNCWNLLTRRNPKFRFYNWKIALIWLLGLFFRYLVLVPVRALNCITSVTFLIICMTVISYIPEWRCKRFIYEKTWLMCFHVLSRWLGCVLKFHNVQYRPKNGIVVSNHTTPFDALTLSTDICYSITGQKSAGLIGLLQRTLNKSFPHIWFDRALISDRDAVTKRLREHVSNIENPPILIFPEGTCINNTAVALFKKGAFEVGTIIHPIALKYDARFGDAFWNSSKQSGLQHVFEMITSWFIVCDIWYLPPVERKANESSIEFANRVKSYIAKRMNVIDLTWDGQLKRLKPKAEWKELHRMLFCEKLKSRVQYDIM